MQVVQPADDDATDQRPGIDPAARPTRPTRLSALNLGVAVGLLFLVLLLVFILQNLRNISVHFFTARFTLPVGVVILAAAVVGGLVVLLVSAARAAQIRVRARRRAGGRVD